MAFKIFSQKPLSSRTYRLVDTIADDVALSSTRNLDSSLRHLFRITTRPFSLDDGVTDVWFQLFRRAKGIGIRERVRQWNLTCQLYRTGPDAGASKASLLFAMPHLIVSQRGRLLGPRLGGCKLSFQLSAHLRPRRWNFGLDEAIQDRNLTAGPRHGPIESFVEGFLKAAAESISRQKFNDTFELISTVKQGILSFLQASPLKDTVDFHDLMIELTRDSVSRRFLSSTLLKADEIERSGFSLREHSSTAYESGSDKSPYSTRRLSNEADNMPFARTPLESQISNSKHNSEVAVKVDQSTSTIRLPL